MSFLLAGEDYAIRILKVREIISHRESTPLPETPPAVEGVINLRGRIVPLVDLRVQLGLEARAITRETCIIVTDVERSRGERVQIGCIVDAVSEVLDLDNGQLEPAPPMGGALQHGFILALAKRTNPEGVVTLLDIDRVLHDLVTPTITPPEANKAA